ncbi:MAG TPA: hypothetical protein VFA48_04820 [Gammaproteobacteria bacterium]|nr:hypothetical protein [Gammaproteobacteria bacterium]
MDAAAQLTTVSGTAQQEDDDRRYARGTYEQYESHPAWVGQMIRDAERAGIISTGVDSRGSGRRESVQAVNLDVYGWWREPGLVAVQARHYYRPRRDWYPEITKLYGVMGRHEHDGTPWVACCRPGQSPLRSRRALETPEATVRWALTRLWGIRESDIEDLQLQGDVALLPVRALPEDAEPLDSREITIRDSHMIRAPRDKAILVRTGDDRDREYYVPVGTTVRHSKREHSPLRARGLRRVITARQYTPAFLGDGPVD